MSAAFTPGPWRVGEKYPTDVYADRAGHAIARAVNPQYKGECEANARLIAAAPDLLEALQKIAAAGTTTFNGVEMTNEQADIALVAIAKAIGETA